MNKEIRALLGYRLERANEAIEEAQIMLDSGHTNAYVNRLYYACFYAASALLLLKGFSSSKHTGIRSFLHQHLVKPGVIAVELGQLYDRLFDTRHQGDYEDFVRFEVEEVAGWFSETQQFVSAFEKYIHHEIESEIEH